MVRGGQVCSANLEYTRASLLGKAAIQVMRKEKEKRVQGGVED